MNDILNKTMAISKRFLLIASMLSSVTVFAVEDFEKEEKDVLYTVLDSVNNGGEEQDKFLEEVEAFAEKTTDTSLSGLGGVTLSSIGVPSLTSFVVQPILLNSLVTPLAIEDNGTPTPIDATVAFSGKSSLSDLSTLIGNLKKSNAAVNASGYPFVPYEDADYKLKTNGGKYIDVFWHSQISTDGGTTYVDRESDTKFYALQTDGTEIGTYYWYDINTNEIAPQGWTNSPRGVAMFGSGLGTGTTTPFLYNIPRGGEFYCTGIIVGTNTEASYVNVASNTTDPSILIFEKTDNDKQYGEFSVDLFINGSLEISGFTSIVVNSSVLVNKLSKTSTPSWNATSVNLILDSPLVGGLDSEGRKNIVYFEKVDLTMKSANEDYVGDWFFGYKSTVKFDFPTASNNPFGTGDINFRASSIRFSGTINMLEKGDVYIEMSNNVNIDGADGTTGNTSIAADSRGLIINEAARTSVFNYETKAYNRFYRVISGNISDGERGVGGILWGNSNSSGKTTNDMSYKNESWIFTGDNSGYGATAWYKDNSYYNLSDYALWQLGARSYSSASMGIVAPFIFGDGSEFSYKDSEGNLNYYAIAGYGGFSANSANVNIKGVATKGHTGVGFNYSNDVEINNAFFGSIRVYHLGTGSLELKNTNSTFDAGVWVTNGGTLKVSNVSTLGTGGLNILSGTLEYTGESAEFDYVIDNKSAISRQNYYGTNSVIKTYEQKHFGDWGVNITNAATNLSWDATKTDAYSTSYGVETNVRSGNFTKSGAGTFTISAGTLVNSSEWRYDSTTGLGSIDTARYRPDVTISAGTLAFTGTASLGDYSTLYMNGGAFSSEANIIVGLGADSGAQRIYSSVTGGKPDFHSLSVGNGTGTLTLAGGTLAYEFSNVEATGSLIAVQPSWNCINLNGNFAVDETLHGNIEFVFKNGAMLTEGFYKLLVAQSDISETVIQNLNIIGISALPGNENSRQTIELLLGNGTTTSLSNNVSPEGTAKELYAYVTPTTALLHWNNVENGTWAQKTNDNGNLAENWVSLDKNVSDTNFYENDSVVFCDQNHGKGVEDSAPYCDSGIKTATHTITISGTVIPLQTIVSAELDNYIFRGSGSIAGEGRLEKNGAGTLTIYTTNTFTGGADISNGIVNALAETALGKGTIRVYKDGNLNVGAIEKTNFGENTSIVNNVLYGKIQLESAGIINIFGSNELAIGSTVNVSGGSLSAFATGSLKNASINVTGGNVYASADSVFDTSNSIILSGASEDSIARLYVTELNALNSADVVVNPYSELHLSAGQANAGIITLNGGDSSSQRDGALIIEAEHSLGSTDKIVFHNGGVIVLEEQNVTRDISFFNNYEFNAEGSSFGISTGSKMIVAGGSLLFDKEYNLKKFGSGALAINVGANEILSGSIVFEDTTHTQLGDDAGTVIMNFGGTDFESASAFGGGIKGIGTLRTEGDVGRIATIAGAAPINFEYAAHETYVAADFALYTEDVLKTWESTTKFAAGAVRINSIGTDNIFFTGTIVNGTSEAEVALEKNVIISASP